MAVGGHIRPMLWLLTNGLVMQVVPISCRFLTPCRSLRSRRSRRSLERDCATIDADRGAATSAISSVAPNGGVARERRRKRQGTSNPITLARAYYWQGRAADALGKTNDAGGPYATAARYSTAYYGQLARARLGLKDIVMPSPPDRASARADVVRAIEILYDVGERDLIAGGLAELGERSRDVATLAAVGEVAARHQDARAMA